MENVKDYNNNIFVKRSVFWKYFLMMSCFIMILILVQFFSNRHLLRLNSEKMIQEEENTLKVNCKTLSDKLSMVTKLPYILEDSRQYAGFDQEKSNSVPDKYVSSCMEIRRMLINRAYLMADYEEFGCYYSNINTVISRVPAINTPEKFFTEQAMFSDTDTETLLKLLKKKGTLVILPSQEVQLPNLNKTVRGITMISHPSECSTAACVIYNEKDIVNDLGMQQLPDGSVIQLKDEEGCLLCSYPGGSEVNGNDFCMVSSKTDMLDIVVQVYIPKKWLNSITSEMVTSDWITTAIVAVFSFILCLVFSIQSVKPLKKLVMAHLSENISDKNEILAISSIIKSSEEKSEALSQQLALSYLARIFAGGMLKEDEQIYLKTEINAAVPYRVAMISVETEDEMIKLLETVHEYMKGFADCISMSISEAGILFGEAYTDQFCSLLTDFQNESAHSLRCGISNSFRELEGFNVYIRQAVMAYPDKPGISSYVDNEERKDQNIYSWSGHEKFYQSIISGNEDAALKDIRKIAESVDNSMGSLVYDMLQFVIICSGNEIGIKYQELECHPYNSHRTASANIAALEDNLRRLFKRMAEEKASYSQKRQSGILNYIRIHAMEESICVAQVTGDLKVTEAEVTEAIHTTDSTSFVDYVNYIRIREAIRMLTETDSSVRDIMTGCGFISESTFFRVFKQSTGMTPKVYRNNRKKMTYGQK